MPSDPALFAVYDKYVDAITNPTGCWKDYNSVYNYYLQLIELRKGILAGTELPPAPIPSDYPDLSNSCESS